MAKLTHEDHVAIAYLLKASADNLTEAAHIVKRAAWTDRALYVGGSLQEWLIDPLSDAWRELGRPVPENPYPSVGYGGPHRRQRPPARKAV
jgi:hypothetical protein